MFNVGVVELLVMLLVLAGFVGLVAVGVRIGRGRPSD